MKRAFTLIEILLSTVIVVLLSVGAGLYLNNFNDKETLKKGREEVVLSIKLAQSYAKTKQLPLDSTETNLKYVQVQIISPNMVVAGVNGIGSTYFAYKIGDDNELSIEMSPSPLYFWGGSGFLSHDDRGTIYGDQEEAKIMVYQNKSGNNEEVIVKNLLVH